MEFNITNVFSAFMVLFAVIDIIGSIPIILDLKNKGNVIKAGQASVVAFIIMILFLFVGEALLKLFGVDISSFAIAGSFILFFLALEMVLGIEIFKNIFRINTHISVYFNYPASNMHPIPQIQMPLCRF